MSTPVRKLGDTLRGLFLHHHAARSLDTFTCPIRSILVAGVTKDEDLGTMDQVSGRRFHQARPASFTELRSSRR